MAQFTKFKHFLFGVGAASGALYYYNDSRSNGKVFAARINSYETLNAPKWDDDWDRRSPKHATVLEKSKKSEKDVKDLNNNVIKSNGKSRAMRHIILIRHGQYNLRGATDADRTLTDLGKMQAEYTGKRLKELGHPYTIMVQSTMSRAQETGSILSNYLSGVPVEHCDLIREGAPIHPEPSITSWTQENHKFFIDGARIEAAFRKYFHRAPPQQEKDSYTVLACHANVIRYFVCRALQFPAEAWLRLSLHHGSITWIQITPNGRVILRSFGETGHMPPEAVTTH